MEIGKLTYRQMNPADAPFILQLIKESPQWKTNELKDLKLEEYFEMYTPVKGEWRVWDLNQKPVAVTFHVVKAQSNDKPWIGTIIVKENNRLQGVGKSVIHFLLSELKQMGSNVVFAGVPYSQLEWIDFLSRCNFEQFKVEKDELGVSYIIMINPL